MLEKALKELKVIRQVFEKDTNVENIQEFFMALDVEGRAIISKQTIGLDLNIILLLVL